MFWTRLVGPAFMKPLLLAAMSGLVVSQPLAAVPVLDLSGEWRCALDAADEGIAENWPSGNTDFPERIRLPGTTDLAGLGSPKTEAGTHDYFLTRRREHVGPAWYARVFEIPDDGAGPEFSLHLERVMWQSRVWVDGVESANAEDSLCAPHVHHLGRLAPGKHRLVLRVDNRMIHPIGDKGHAYGEQTQTCWNGVVGRIELHALPPRRIEAVRVFPSLDGRVEVEISGTRSGDGPLKAAAFLIEHGRRLEAVAADLTNGAFQCRIPLALAGKPRVWSEFDPALYQVAVRLMSGGACLDERVIDFGFREVSRDGNKLLVNRMPAFLRGNLECALFPETGHPPADEASWERIWNVYRAHGLNHARFHSWCPPEAAFAAADRAGIYLQVEAPIWMDRWMAAPNNRPEMDTAGHPRGLGRNDRGNDEFARAEIRRILDTYGNHPSFVFFCIGNELGTSDFEVTGRWIAEAKKYDPRHLYAASTARTITPHCDFNATHNVPGIGSVRQHLEFGTAWDYEGQYGRAKVPIIAHEIGQWPVYMDWDADLPRYDGCVTAPLRLQQMRAAAEKAGLLGQARDLRAASGASNRLLYRDEIESFLRTPSCRGFQLLGMQDFTGQGEAMVGWLDPFYQSKGTTTPEEFRRYCAPTVALLKLPGYVFRASDKPVIRALLHHYGEADRAGAETTWRLLGEGGGVLDSGSLGRMDFAAGALHDCGAFTPSFAGISSAGRYTLEIQVGGPAWSNTYPIWVFPDAPPEKKADGLFVARDWNDETKAQLQRGGRVLLVADRLGGRAASELAQWQPLYWSVPFFPGQNRDTLGLLVRNEHPAFRGFPTGSFGDWNWFRICQGARGFDLTDLVPHSFLPLAQPITDFHLNRRLGSIFEVRVGSGALLVCGYDISAEKAARFPEVASLRRALLAYAASPEFAPQTPLAVEALDRLFADPEQGPVAVPERFKQADLYVRCAARVVESGRSLPWKPEVDAALLKLAGVDYTVIADGVWKDVGGTAWHGKSLKIIVKPRAGVPGSFFARFHDWNHNGRRGKVTFEGVERDLAAHTEGVWMEFEVIREDTNDGQLVLSAETLGGPNLMITDIAFVPAE